MMVVFRVASVGFPGREAEAKVASAVVVAGRGVDIFLGVCVSFVLLCCGIDSLKLVVVHFFRGNWKETDRERRR